MTDDTRRAPAAWAYQAPDGSRQGGEHEAVIGDDGLTVGPVTIAFLDADELHAADYHIAIGLWPGGRLELSQLGRRFDAFVAALKHARNQARVAGLLCHAPEMPTVFEGAITTQGAPRPAEIQLYPTHVTIIPDEQDPFQRPLGADLSDLGQMGRRRDAFADGVRKAKRVQDETLSAYTGQPGFADGLGMARKDIRDFDGLLARCTSPERLEGARTMLGHATAEARLGFVQLLDPDDAGNAAATPLPNHWASFLLVPAGKLVALEILAGPGAATYVFEGAIDDINRDLQLLHFRRAGLALGESQAHITPENPHRLALRRLEPLKRLRAATRARLVHSDSWPKALADALGAG